MTSSDRATADRAAAPGATADRTASSLTTSIERRPRRCIAVEGPIGVGKTSLARRLAEALELEMVLEPGFDNPFLERFYRQGREFALPAQLHFLLRRGELLQQLAEPDLFRAGWVCDFVLEKDKLFAELTLADDELALYHQLHERFARQIQKPDLVVYLQATPDILMERIKQRGLAPEQRITREYLDSLCAAYTQLFHYYDQSRVLIVNAAADFIHDETQFADLVQRILNTQGPREYYNPRSGLI